MAKGAEVKPALDWLKDNHDKLVKDLAALVAIPSVSTDGKHKKQIERSAKRTCTQMRAAGLQNVEILRVGESNPYAYGEWLGAPGKPTVFLYAHHDVQPAPQDKWASKPWELTRKAGRLYGRGSADDKGAITAQLGAVAAYLQTSGQLPVNVKMVVEGEEEVGSQNLMKFFKEQKKRIQADVIVVCDTENAEVGLPCITYSLRGIVAVNVEVKSAKKEMHSGTAGGALADAALALNVILSRLFWDNGKLPIPGMYDGVRPVTSAERRGFEAVPADEAKLRKELGIPNSVRLATEKGHGFREQTWRYPAVTIIAQQASSFEHVSNQVLPTAKAVVSCRIVPDQDPQQVLKCLTDLLTADPPWGVQVTAEPRENPVKWWMTDPQGPAFEAARAALLSGFKKDPVGIGSGGSIGFVGPLADLLGGAPALLLGIEDPRSSPHAPDESLHEGDWKKLMASLVYLFENLGNLPNGKVK
jgi:acetylornithine deacetylase/succinyl-diaminopimelate desuccinylase-like protein